GGGQNASTTEKPAVASTSATSQSENNGQMASNGQSTSTSSSDAATVTSSASTIAADNTTSSAQAQTADQSAQNTPSATNDSTTQPSAKATKVNKNAHNELKVKKTTYKKLTKYNKQSAQKIVQRANQVMKATQKQVAKGQKTAKAKSNDNIPQDDALTAISTHQKAQQAKVLKTVKAAQKIAVKNKKQATTKLNAALSLVADMHDNLNQATALVAADKKGVKAHVVANAQAAYNQVSVPNGTSARVDDYGDLIVTASNARSYNKVLKTIHKQGLTGSFRQIVDPAQEISLTLNGPTGASTTDADGNLTVDETKVNAQGPVITANLNISGNKGDTFFITVPSGYGLSWTDHTISTQTSNKDGSTTITWKLDQDGITKKETIQYTYGAMYPAQVNDLAKSPETGNFFPSTDNNGGPNYQGVVPDGVLLPISYGGSNIDTQYKKITYSNKRTLDSIGISAGVLNDTKTAGPDYNYFFKYSLNNGFNSLGVATVVIDLPANFVFDPDETDYIQKNSMRTGIGVNTFKVLPGNKLQITVGGQNHFLAFPGGQIPFAGHYTDGTVGAQTFKVESFQTAYLPGSDGKAPIIANNGAESQSHFTTNSSDFNSGHSYAVNNVTYTETLTNDKVTKMQINAPWVNTNNTLVIGATSNNILANFQPANLGNTTINPTYTITIPDGVESTGISLPLNQSINTNWPKDTTYDVTVNYSDGTNQSFTKLGSGTTVSSINGTDVQLMSVPTGAHVSSYVINQSEQVKPDNFLAGNDYDVVNGGEAWFVASYAVNSNDDIANAFTVLGNVGTKDVATVKDGQQLSIKMTVNDKNSNYQGSANSTFTATTNSSTELSLGKQDFPGGLNPGDTYTTTIGFNYGNAVNDVIGTNLNANAFRDSKGGIINRPSTSDPNDQTGYAGNSRSIFEPVIYITTPAQMKLVTNSKTGLPFTENGIGWKGVTDNPKISNFVNADGLTVTKLDYTGTGFEWVPANQNMSVTFKVNDDAVSGFIPWNSSIATGDGNYNGSSYVNNRDFANSGLTSANNAATKFGKTGESVAVVMVQGNEISSQIQSSQADLQNLYIQTADGQKIAGLSAIQDWTPNMNGAATLTNNPKLSGNLYISAPQSMILNGATFKIIKVSAQVSVSTELIIR
ncbi:hypothetical protein, partial [Lentilactobacillus kisonensis]